MTDKEKKARAKELKKLRREQLLEMLLESEKNNRELKEALTAEQEKNEELTRKLEDRSIRLEEAGNIAEAALKLNEVFEAAQKAAEEYLENVRAMAAGNSSGQ